MAQSSICGVITEVFNPVVGTSDQGKEWMRQTILVKKFTNSQFESFVALELRSKEMINALKPVVGLCGEFFYDAESRQSKNDDTRWFTSLSLYKIKPFQMAATNAAEQIAPQANPVYPPQTPTYPPQTPAYAPQTPVQPSGWAQPMAQGYPQNGYPSGGQNGNDPF